MYCSSRANPWWSRFLVLALVFGPGVPATFAQEPAQPPPEEEAEDEETAEQEPQSFAEEIVAPAPARNRAPRSSRWCRSTSFRRRTS
jgi:hypothetical protein